MLCCIDFGLEVGILSPIENVATGSDFFSCEPDVVAAGMNSRSCDVFIGELTMMGGDDDGACDASAGIVVVGTAER